MRKIHGPCRIFKRMLCRYHVNAGLFFNPLRGNLQKFFICLNNNVRKGSSMNYIIGLKIYELRDNFIIYTLFIYQDYWQEKRKTAIWDRCPLPFRNNNFSQTRKVTICRDCFILLLLILKKYIYSYFLQIC